MLKDVVSNFWQALAVEARLTSPVKASPTHEQPWCWVRMYCTLRIALGIMVTANAQPTRLLTGVDTEVCFLASLPGTN